MTGGRTVLILGGGVGGVVAATRLRQRLSKDHRVVLIDREADHLFQPSLLWVMVGARDAGRIRRPLERLRRKGIEVVRGEVEAMDPVERRAWVDGRERTGDAVIVTLGAELAPEAVPGLAEGGHNLYTLPGAVALRDALRRLERGRVVVVTAAPSYKCPAAPYEAALLLEGACRRRGIRGDVELRVYAAEPGPLAVAGPHVSAAVRGMLEEKGIAYHPEHSVRSVDPVSRRLVFTNGVEAEYDLLAYVPPHRPPALVRDAGLAGDGDWVRVDRHTLRTDFPWVFAVGDVTSIPLALGKPLPKAGVFAHRQAEVVARNLALAWTGRGRPERFDGRGSCFIEAGDGRAGYGAGDFYAEPVPRVRIHRPAWWWHVGKVLFEQSWLRRWF